MGHLLMVNGEWPLFLAPKSWMGSVQDAKSAPAPDQTNNVMWNSLRNLWMAPFFVPRLIWHLDRILVSSRSYLYVMNGVHN